MRRKIDNADTFSTVPDSDKSLTDYFGDEYEYEQYSTNTIFLAFNTKTMEINNLCKSLLLDVGEVQAMYGKFWRDVKYGQLDNVKEWLRMNARKNIEILNPEMHRSCMNSPQYQRWYERGILE
jgi:hypothetical protein